MGNEKKKVLRSAIGCILYFGEEVKEKILPEQNAPAALAHNMLHGSQEAAT
jgi:hypothetical protein